MHLDIKVIGTHCTVMELQLSWAVVLEMHMGARIAGVLPSIGGCSCHTDCTEKKT